MFLNKLFSVTEVFRLSTSHIVLTFMGIKFKIIRENPVSGFFRAFKSGSDFGKNNKVIEIDEKGNQKTISLKKVKGICINFQGNDNTLILHKPYNFVRSDIVFEGSNATVEFGNNCGGKWRIFTYYKGSQAKIGNNTQAMDIQIVLLSNSIEIGNNCLISNNVRILTDAHSVQDYSTKEILNKPDRTIKIGNHVWIGERVSLTKNAQIPNDTIVGLASVVTKTFQEEHTVIAGSPAKVVKQNVSWDFKSPV